MKVLLICLLSIGATLAVKSVTEFFPEFKKDVSKLKWVHAANTKTNINEALKDKDIRMLEVDVQLVNGVPKLKHDGIASDDTELKEFINIIISHNKDTNNKENTKGIKLDFKTSEALKESLKNDILLGTSDTIRSDIDFPLWINADIAKGPKGGDPVILDSSDLAKLKGATLSMGWTTGVPDTEKKEAYTEAQTTDIKNKLDILNVGQDEEVTYPVRAAYAAESYDVLKALINPDKRSITIWSADEDTKKVDVEKLRKLIKDNKEKVYVDVPKDLQELINSARIAAPLITVLVGSFAFLRLL